MMVEKKEKTSSSEKEKKVEKKEKEEEEEKKEEEKKEETPQDKGISGIAIFIVLLLIILGFAYWKWSQGNIDFGNEEIVIGFMGPLTGDAASYGHGIKRGVELALKDSGLENIKIIYEDTKCEGKEAVNAVNKLINVDGVVAIVGEVCSGATLAAAPIAEKSEVVMISASSTSPEITDSGDYIFRTVPSDTLQGDFAANLLYNDGIRKLAMLYGNEEYGVGFKEVLETSFGNLGGEVVAAEAFERGSVDLRTQLTKIKKEKPEAIFIVSNSPDSAVAALKQIKQLFIKSKIYGSEGLKGPEVAKTTAGEGLVVTSVSSGTADFAVKYMNSYGLKVEPFAPQAYDAFSILARALKEGAKKGPEIKDKLYGIRLNGISGNIVFDENGDVQGNYEVYQLVNGSFVLR